MTGDESSLIGFIVIIIIVMFFMAVAVVYLFIQPSSWLAILSILASAVSVLIGIDALSKATTGVGLIAVGCWLGIAGRIIQAEMHKNK